MASAVATLQNWPMANVPSYEAYVDMLADAIGRTIDESAADPIWNYSGGWAYAWTGAYASPAQNY